MPPRLPNPRYIGDGVYVEHDSNDLVIMTSNGIDITNRIVLGAQNLVELNRFIDYTQQFYRSNQHRLPAGCDGCGTDIADHANVIPHALSAEVYKVQKDDTYHEIRLCHDCAHNTDHSQFEELIRKQQESKSRDSDANRQD